ncbi:MAG: ATP-dependent helicase RecG [Acidimicrobiaceae bacterium]|nr:ATP-dependent helicase RecG [Acidimicrobiaceae bacterium]
MARRLSQLADLPVSVLNGVGAKSAADLAAIDVLTVLDLLTHYPRRHVDRSREARIADLREGDDGLVLAEIKRVATRRARNHKILVEVDVSDESGFLRCTFFNQSWRAKQLSEGANAAFFGKVTTFRGKRQMANPLVDLIGNKTGKIVPIYPQSADLSTWEIGRWVEEALQRAGDFADPLPQPVRDELDVVDRTWAFRQIHQPDSMGAVGAARKRLAFDELFRLQVALVMRKRAVEREAKGIQHNVDGELAQRFRQRLPFPLTGAQRRAIDQIESDLAGVHPMHRLLQGDVGAGKTVVAVSALLVSVQGGHQGALMAPTEVLAEQHFLGVRSLLADLTVPDETGSLFEERPVRVDLLTNRTTAKERTRLLAGLDDGSVDILIGTHALLTEGVAFKDLGVVVIDEQHRFGVEQRAALRGKGNDPDVLVMTATPIPRTAAMTVYGDLDVTVLDELPPGRTPIRTVWARGPLEEAEAWARVKAEVAAGRQAYVVCPLVDESERVQARSATDEFERLRAEVFPDLRLGLLHGQMRPADKESAMAAFRRAELDVLVATTVIEVGVDVPNATVMVIEDADRFGIAQLHQLRGRVGRGAAESWCYLLGGDPESERLAAVERSTDGFALAEVDLEIRGEGTVLGTKQKGVSDLKLASLRRDRDLIEQARSIAFRMVDADPLLDDNPVLADEVRALLDDDEAAFLFKS